jgi:hypothetical protein
VLPACNTEAMQLHLDEIATKVTPGAHAVLILDQAGWHGAKDLEAPKNISLLPLPPRAPGAQSSKWQFMRASWLSNRIFKSFDEIVDHCCYAWNTLDPNALIKERYVGILTAKFIQGRWRRNGNIAIRHLEYRAEKWRSVTLDCHSNFHRRTPLLSVQPEQSRFYEYTPFCNGPGDVKSPRVMIASPSSRFCPWSTLRPPHCAVRGSGEPI